MKVEAAMGTVEVKAEAATTDDVFTKMRTHYGYDWTVEESVLYNKPGKSGNDCETHYAAITKFPLTLPASDYQAKVWITLLSTPSQEPFCVYFRNLEKAKTSARSQRSSTIQQTEAIQLDSSSEDDDTKKASNRKRKASQSPPTSPKPRMRPS